jgi:hypothetical protein
MWLTGLEFGDRQACSPVAYFWRSAGPRSPVLQKLFFSVARGWPLGQVYQQTATLHETDAYTRQVKCLEGMRSPVYIALYVGQSALKFE